MAVQRHPIRCRDDEGGGFEERFCRRWNAPCARFPQGQARLHHPPGVEDVTETWPGWVRTAADPTRWKRPTASWRATSLLRSQELWAGQHGPAGRPRGIRTGKSGCSISGCGPTTCEQRPWTCRTGSGELLRVPPGSRRAGFSMVTVALVHPDNRAPRMGRRFHDFLTVQPAPLVGSKAPHPAQRWRWWSISRAWAERKFSSTGRETDRRLVQDVTPYVMAEQRLVAGHRADEDGRRPGPAWRLAGGSRCADGQLVRRDKPRSTRNRQARSPPVDQALDYYLPEGRPPSRPGSRPAPSTARTSTR